PADHRRGARRGRGAAGRRPGTRRPADPGPRPVRDRPGRRLGGPGAGRRRHPGRYRLAGRRALGAADRVRRAGGTGGAGRGARGRRRPVRDGAAHLPGRARLHPVRAARGGAPAAARPPGAHGLSAVLAWAKNVAAAAAGVALLNSTLSAAWVSWARICACPAGGGGGGLPNCAARPVSNATEVCIGAVSSGATWLRTPRLGARPRSAPSSLPASRSLTRKLMRSATWSGYRVWLDADQYMEARSHCPAGSPG